MANTSSRRIHPTALVSPEARLGASVSIGAFTIVHANVEIGDGTVIESHCEIGHPAPRAKGRPLVLGQESHIRSYSCFYEGSTFGPGLLTGHRVTVRELTVAGEGLQIGTLSDIQGTCSIGRYARMHSNVHVGQDSRIGNFVWLFPYVVLTNDPHPPSDVQLGPEVEDFAAIATMSVILPGVKVGEHSLVSAHSCVGKDVPPHTVVWGSPARVLCEASHVKLRDGTGRAAYPWPAHFSRGYPEHVVKEWMDRLSDLVPGLKGTP
ncbi:MAG TPA: N-acetyltransferase [Burkholderiaceae bacterium]|nr:N-acetyltransferase [Burkholderiaceae bacterium]